jgi:alanine dehydrogenase
MSLFLGETDVQQLLTLPLALEAVEDAHRALSLQQGCDVPRQRTRLPQTTLHILQGALPHLDVIGYKAYTSNRSGVRFLVHLYRASTGRLLAVVEADRLGMVRTGGGVGCCYALAGQARCHGWPASLVLAGSRGASSRLAAVRPLQRVKVSCAPCRSRLAAFCVKMSERLGIEVAPRLRRRRSCVAAISSAP